MKSLYISLCVVAGIAFAFGAQKPLNKTECVEWHNYYRKMHQAPDIEWSTQVASDAQSWADDLAKRDAFEHSSNNNAQGENLYKSGGDSDYSCRNAIKAFYKEEPKYNYEAGKYVSGAGHFTQVVWVKSTQIGVGKAITAKGAIILVFRYKPPGNVIGQFKENVKPSISGGKAFTHTPSYTMVLAVLALVIGQSLF